MTDRADDTGAADPDATPAVARLVERVRESTLAGLDEAATTTLVAEALADAVAAGIAVPEPFTRPHPERYAMYPLHVEPDGGFSVSVAVWGVGQRTPIHDHLVWGVVGVLSGAEEEIRYGRPQGTAPEELGRTVHRAGAVTVCCTTDDDVHQVAAAGDEPCVALHIYGGDIGTIVRHSFDPTTGTAKDFTSTWTEPGPRMEAAP